MSLWKWGDFTHTHLFVHSLQLSAERKSVTKVSETSMTSLMMSKMTIIPAYSLFVAIFIKCLKLFGAAIHTFNLNDVLRIGLPISMTWSFLVRGPLWSWTSKFLGNSKWWSACQGNTHLPGFSYILHSIHISWSFKKWGSWLWDKISH